MKPTTLYARSGDLHIAYQVFGDGPDLLYLSGWFGSVDLLWEEPAVERFLLRLASFARVIMLDVRGSGVSDRVAQPVTLEEQVEDAVAVMDAAGSQSATWFGVNDGSWTAALAAATRTERVKALIAYGVRAKHGNAADYPWGSDEGAWNTFTDFFVASQLQESTVIPSMFIPSAAENPARMDFVWRLSRAAGSPGAIAARMRYMLEVDLRPVLGSILAPTLVIGRTHDVVLDVEGLRDFAARIPGAKLVEVAGSDLVIYFEESESILDEIQEFLTGVRGGPDEDRVLATVLFTDIAGSTETAARMGDKRWTDVLQGYYQMARRQLERFRGREVKTIGDGFLITFDGAARAIRCAQAIVEGARAIGLDVRAGVHTGECEVIGADLAGLAVHIGSRIAGVASPGEVLVSSTVRDLVAGSGIGFADKGMHALKGVPDSWRLFTVER